MSKIKKTPAFQLESVEIDSVSALVNYISEHEHDCEIPNVNKKFLNRNFFRGEKQDFGRKALLPKIFRTPSFKRYETDILLDLISHSPEEFSTKTTFEQLVLAQHYGAPTRLLDITTNPLIGLYFACESYSDKKSKNKDGIVYRFIILEPEIHWSNSSEVEFISNISKLGSMYGTFGGNYKEHLNKLILEVRKYNQKTLFPDSGTKEEKEARKALIRYCERSKIYDFLNGNKFNAMNANVNLHNIENVICVKPQNLDLRISNQSSYFLLFGENANLKNFTPPIFRVQKMIIPHKEKEKIIEDLALLNISPMTIFPDIYTKSRFMGELFKTKKDYFFEYKNK